MLDLVISVWLVGFIINEIKQLYFKGLVEYLFSMNNIVTVFMLVLYVVSFGLKFYTFLVVRLERRKLDDANFWHELNHLDPMDHESQAKIFGTFYWLNEDRFYWFSLDPINLSEGLLAFATLFTFGKLCFYLPANQNLGPLQITVGRMIFVSEKNFFFIL